MVEPVVRLVEPVWVAVRFWEPVSPVVSVWVAVRFWEPVSPAVRPVEPVWVAVRLWEPVSPAVRPVELEGVRRFEDQLIGPLLLAHVLRSGLDV